MTRGPVLRCIIPYIIVILLVVVTVIYVYLYFWVDLGSALVYSCCECGQTKKN